MGDLQGLKDGYFNGIRRNDVARNLGESMSRGDSSVFDDKYGVIEPALKDKLINDQVRVNYMREQRDKIMNEMMPEIDELDILQKELEHRNMPNEVMELANEYEGRNTPNRAAYLGTIRENIERQAAAPVSGGYFHPPPSRGAPPSRGNAANLPPHVP